MSGKATLMPDVRGECRTTAAHSNRDARSTVGTVPMLWPYRMMFSGLMPYLETRAQTHARGWVAKTGEETRVWLVV